MYRPWFMAVSLTVFGLALGLAQGGTAHAQGEKGAGKDKKKGGTVTGVITKKGPNFIEVKAFGEEEPRQYVPHWVGGLPKDGGGPDKKMLAVFAKLKVGDQVRVVWEFEERARAVQVDLLKKETKEKQ